MALEIIASQALSANQGVVSASKETNKTQKSFESVNEVVQYISQKYGVYRADKTIEGIPDSINVSPAFLQKALKDPEKMQWLEENLEAMQTLDTSRFMGTLTNVSYSIDSEGNITMITSGSSDPDGKIAKENAKRKAEEKREKERLEQKRLEEQKEEQKQLEELGQKAINGTIKTSFQLSFSAGSVKTLQTEFANALQSGISLDMKA